MNEGILVPIGSFVIAVTLGLAALRVAFSAHERLTRHDERIENTIKAVAAEKVRNDSQDVTQTAQGLILARVDANVEQILKHQQSHP